MENSCNEDDAALVDSFFLPGGLFADEADNHSDNDTSENLRSRPMHTRSIMHSSVIPSQVPQNPWEKTDSNNHQSQIYGDMPGSSSILHPGINFSPHRPPHVSLPSANRNGSTFHVEQALKDLALEESSSGTSFQRSLLYQKQSDIHSQRNYSISSETNKTRGNTPDNEVALRRILRPPPGFQSELQNIVQTSITDPRICKGEIGGQNDSESIQDPINVIANKNTAVGSDYRVPTRDILKPNLFHPSMNDTLPKTFHNNLYFDSSVESLTGKTDSKRECQEQEQTVNQQSNHDDMESNLTRRHKEPIAPTDVSNATRESPPQNLNIISKTSPNVEVASASEISGPLAVEDDEIRDDRCEGDEDEEDTTIDEDNSIPSNICGSSGVESNVSSLITGSEVDNNSDISSYASGSDNHNSNRSLCCRDEGIGYDTDQAHVSAIDGLLSMGSATGSVTHELVADDTVDASAVLSSSDKYSKDDKTTAITVGDRRYSCQENQGRTFSFLGRLFELLIFIVNISTGLCHNAVQLLVSAVRGSSLFLMILKRRQRFSQQWQKLSRCTNILTKRVFVMEEVFVIFRKQLLQVGRKTWEKGKMVAKVVFRALEQLLRFSLIEAVEEFRGVTTCYLVFYILPNLCDYLVGTNDLPHWTPHIVMWVAIFSLCNQVDDGPLYKTGDVKITSFLREKCTQSLSLWMIEVINEENENPYFAESKPDPKTSTSQREQRVDVVRAKDEHACCIALKLVRTFIPVFFFVEGFSSEFGSFVGVTSAQRLITAYDMCLIRKTLIKSPIASVSWAFQILMATYCQPSVFLDLLLALTGFSTIRLIRYRNVQRLQKRKSYKYKQ